MDRDIMLIWIRKFLEEADDKTLRNLMWFIKGYVEGAAKRNDKQAATGQETSQVAGK